MAVIVTLASTGFFVCFLPTCGDWLHVDGSLGLSPHQQPESVWLPINGPCNLHLMHHLQSIIEPFQQPDLPL